MGGADGGGGGGRTFISPRNTLVLYIFRQITLDNIAIVQVVSAATFCTSKVKKTNDHFAIISTARGLNEAFCFHQVQ